MSNIVLPTERRKALDYNPKMVVFFGKYKSGKSTCMASLESNLIIDLEDGYRALEVMCVQARSAADLFHIKSALEEKIKENGGKLPYKYITIDNATRLEELALFYAKMLYRRTNMGKMWGYKKDSMGNLIKDEKGNYIEDTKADIRLLPEGAGYLYLRKAVKELIDMFKPLCTTLILVAHVKDKQIKKNGEQQSEMQVDLAGKLSDIICGEADAIGYIYRESNKTIISFEGGSDTLRGARPLHLKEKRFVVAESDENGDIKVDMSQIFLDKLNPNQAA